MLDSAMVDSYEAYSTAPGPLLSERGALRAVLTYANDFISRGDIDVGFTVSGGAICADGRSADPAVWPDWIAAWRTAAAELDEPPRESAADRPSAIDMQHGFRALHVFLARSYQPIHRTPMSAVRADCEAAFGEAPPDAAVWESWLEAIAAGESEDIAFHPS
jgi:hypothetical protein